jgi:hypothetical protein
MISLRKVWRIGEEKAEIQKSDAHVKEGNP